MAKSAKLLGPDDYPNTLSVDEKDLPAIKNWKVDGEYTLEVKVKMTGITKSPYSDNPKIRGDFRILSVKTDDDDDPGMKGFDSYRGDREKPKGRS